MALMPISNKMKKLHIRKKTFIMTKTQSKEYFFAWMLPYRRYIDYEGFTGLVVLEHPFCSEWQAHVTISGLDLPLCNIDPVARTIGTHYFFSVCRSSSTILKAWRQVGFHHALPNPAYREPEQYHLNLSDWDYMRYCSSRESLAYCRIEESPVPGASSDF